MALIDFTSELRAAESLPDLARRLGARCLEAAGELREMKGQDGSARELEGVSSRVKRIALVDWERAIADPAAFGAIADAELIAVLEFAKMRRPLDFLGVLTGICQGALDEFFRTTAARLELDRGMPIPDATRPVPDGVEWMTLPGTQKEGDLLAPLPWSQFDYAKEEGIRVVLDFSHRGRIDELCWTGAERLPRIATVHPRLGKLDCRITRPGRFFDVRPSEPQPEWLLGRLAAAADAEIGVLPELCLARPDELGAAIAAAPAAYPPLIVAGSAHLREGHDAAEVRANQSHVYLDGEHVVTYRKHLPFRTKTLGEEIYPEPLYEDLTGEPKTITVLAATHTRLAVVICADLIDAKIPRRLVAAGVNLMLAPAMTPKAGSFETTVEEISGRCQGVSAIANVRERDDGQPFLCLLGTPRAAREERLAALTGAGIDPPPSLAVFDSHGPLPEAVEWR